MLNAGDDCRDVLILGLCVLPSMSCIWSVCECDSRDRKCGRWLGRWLVWVTRQGVGIVVGLARAMCDDAVELCKTLKPASDLARRRFERMKPCESAMVCLQCK